MITNIEIERNVEDVVITFSNKTDGVVEQAMFENEPLNIATSINAVLLCDTIKDALVDHPLLTDEIPAPLAAGALVDQFILDTFNVIEGDDLDQLRTYVVDTIAELRRK